MRWRTVDGIQTEQRADTPLGEYRVKVFDGGWSWYHDGGAWARAKSYADAQRAAQQHFYEACVSGFRVRTGMSRDTAQIALDAIGITPPPPEREPLNWTTDENGDTVALPRCDTALVYLVRPVCCDRYAAYRRNGWDVISLLPVGSIEACKAACERDREASCR